MRPSIVIIIPAYNEEKSIRETIKNYIESFPHSRIVAIDNNSSDNTKEEILAALRPDHDHYMFQSIQGKGNAVRMGLSRCKADIFIMTDGDLTYKAEDANALMEIMLDTRADMIVGDRLTGGGYAKQNKRPGHSLGNSILTLIVSMFAKKRYNDVLSGLRIMSAPYVNMLDVRSSGFQLETELNISAAYMTANVIEVPIEYSTRPNGSESKLNTIVDGFKILKFAFLNWVAFAPLQFFLGLSFISSAFALFIAAELINQYLTSGTVAAVATAIFGASLGLIAVVSFFIGLLLAITRQDFRRSSISKFLDMKRAWNDRLDNMDSTS